MMGYDVGRFQGSVDEELICPICSGVLEIPVQAPKCEHAFCRACIMEWLSRQATCPVDRIAISTSDLQPVPRILKNLLARLVISCEYAASGCTAMVKLEILDSHVQDCEHNPRRPVLCDQGCGLVTPKDDLKDHNCVRELRSLIQTQQQQLTQLEEEVVDQSVSINEIKRELNYLKEFVRAMRSSHPAMRAIAEQFEKDEVKRWASTLTKAKVSRWGAMISTPDEVLQAMIKRSLSESGCPLHIMEDLMANCHERHWPTGLASLQTRQRQRREYDSYVCRRIPGKQAVLALACDNTHMSEEMMSEPGLVMIFALGIE
ncbi:E3 ubiquitin-protein ligase NRDP1 isoform X1 [Frankliniella occidentalis]|uniref:E3 ubiquitin-protein ligase NRDP1 n=2 Tax=Frankliniella occidentalis TaxID=133901 RepID=A0A6J1SJ64_FRAOC|nr:E3 ubiquitin-protein ligase NRDP1 isoform X1 [Frankliniella occidentalis]